MTDSKHTVSVQDWGLNNSYQSIREYTYCDGIVNSYVRFRLKDIKNNVAKMK